MTRYARRALLVALIPILFLVVLLASGLLWILGEKNVIRDGLKALIIDPWRAP